MNSWSSTPTNTFPEFLEMQLQGKCQYLPVLPDSRHHLDYILRLGTAISSSPWKQRMCLYFPCADKCFYK